jgi:hypothetical protein
MTPHLVRWHSKYSGQGLTIIDVDDGRIDSLDAVRGHVRDEQIRFPVLHDSLGAMCDTYEVNGYPTAYLIDRDGRIVWGGHPSDPAPLERLIQQVLAEKPTLAGVQK